MTKKQVDVFDYAGKICSAMKKGILLTTAAGGNVNTMTIGWGTLGIEWNKPVFVAYVRESRFTRELLDHCGEFTVNIALDTEQKQILSFCGTKSGRDIDKIQEMNLHLEAPINISVPGFREFPLTLECKVVYRNPQPTDNIPQEILDRYFPEKNGVRDFHYAYYGEIVGAYILE